MVRAVTQAGSGYFSAEATAYFTPFPHLERSVKLESTYDPQYHAGGPDGLIDGIRGVENWRKGDWQGFQNTDFVAEVDLGKTISVKHVEIGFMQDFRSWILLPAHVSIEYLDENRIPVHQAEKKIEVRDREENVFLFPVIFDENLLGVRYVRIKATNYGKLPAWHPGKGEPAFIFTDEIIVE